MKKTILFFGTILIVFFACENTSSPGSEQNSEIVTKVELPEKIEFSSLDSLMITANLYHKNDSAPVIVLCHQARFNKFEYDGIALKLHEMGYNCLATDQRSGGPISSKKNETYLRALKAGKATSYIDAEPDIVAAVNFAVEKYKQPVILWGSSYSSTLALYIGLGNENVKAVISFSPGNYMADAKGSLIDKMENFDKPFFVTSSKHEAPGVTELIAKCELSENQLQFIPEGNGNHGSRALWETQEGAEEYWPAVKGFLEKIK